MHYPMYLYFKVCMDTQICIYVRDMQDFHYILELFNYARKCTGKTADYEKLAPPCWSTTTE